MQLDDAIALVQAAGYVVFRKAACEQRYVQKLVPVGVPDDAIVSDLVRALSNSMRQHVVTSVFRFDDDNPPPYITPGLKGVRCEIGYFPATRKEWLR